VVSPPAASTRLALQVEALQQPLHLMTSSISGSAVNWTEVASC